MSIEIAHVSKRFGEFQALDDVSVELRSGELTALLGPSGSGKTTLLRVLAGLETPDRGAVRFDGRDVTQVAPRDRGIGLVFQHYALFRHLDVFENVAFPLRIRGKGAPEIRGRVEELLSLVRLEGLGRRAIDQLSGGQRQRIALARALAAAPKVLLLEHDVGLGREGDVVARHLVTKQRAVAEGAQALTGDGLVVLMQVVATGQKHDVGRDVALHAHHVFEDLLAVMRQRAHGVAQDEQAARLDAQVLGRLPHLDLEDIGRVAGRHRGLGG